MSIVQEKIGTAEYKIKLEETLVSIMNQVLSARTESSVASRFENNLYFFIKDFFEKEIVFDKEEGQGYFRHTFSFKGRMDAISNELVIEYKFYDVLDSRKEQEKAVNQIKSYLQQIYDNTHVSRQGVLTDGKRVCYFYFDDGEIINTSFHTLELADLDMIVKSLLNVGLKQFIPRNIVQDFQLDSQNNLTKCLAMNLFAAINTNQTDKTTMLFKEWQELFRLSESDTGKNQDIVKRKKSLSKIFNIEIKDDGNELEYKCLYVLQTTFAIIIKLIACKALAKIKFNDSNLKYFSDLTKVDSRTLQQFAERLEDGYVFSTGGIRNLLEGDFFSWYADEYQWNKELAKAITDIIIALENYASTSFTFENATIDIFKDLYMQIMPNEVRHSMGEYFTPSWLADQVVSKSIAMSGNKENWRALDPCCGSGVFIVTLIKHILKQYNLNQLTLREKNEILQNVLNRVIGIDLNPLSVLTARIGYLLAIRPLLEDQQFEIPIFLGDSANIPQTEVIENVTCYTYKINTLKGNFDVTLPESFVQSSAFFEKMYILQTSIKAEKSDLLYEQLLKYTGVSDKNSELSKRLLNLADKLVELHQQHWDGIWVRIVTNFMLIARINDLDIIVGNPPWIKWEFLPVNYAEKIKSLCIDKKLFSGQTYMGAISLNLCALIANVAATQWLKKDGVLSFIMPKTIMTQDSYEGFRSFFINNTERMYLQSVDDWEKSGNPFIVTTEKFMTYFYKFNHVEYSDGVPVTFYQKKRGVGIKKVNLLHSFDVAKRYFEVSRGYAYQLTQERTGFTIIPNEDRQLLKNIQTIIGKCDYKARSGVEFTPAEVYFISPIKTASTKERWFFKANEFSTSVYKSDYTKQHFELETKYIRPVVKSPNIKPFRITESDNYCIFPYNNGDRTCVPAQQLVGNSDLLLRYLADNKKLISSQSARSLTIAMGDDFYALSKVGNYTFAPFKVTFRDNTEMCAAVVKKIITPWGEEVSPICAKHAPYISMDLDNNAITEDEAYYISGILNTELVKMYFRFTYSTRSYSINFNIKIPKYQSTNELQVLISKLAKKAENSTDDEIIEITHLLNENYLELCRKSP